MIAALRRHRSPVGRRSRPGLWFLTSLGVALCACKTTQVLTPVQAGQADDAIRIVILKSSDNPIFNAPGKAFVSQMPADTTVYVEVLRDGADETIAALQKVNPHLVFALGTHAALEVRRGLPEVPLVFGMVANYRRFKELAQGDVMGVATEIPAGAEFTKFKMVAPQISRVLAFYTQAHSADLVARAASEMAMLAIELHAVPILSPEDVIKKYPTEGPKVNAVWLLNDPTVMNAATFEYLRAATVTDRLPFVSSLSDRFARNGALMSVSVDLDSLGFQAAAMARRFLEFGDQAAEIGVQPPIGGRLFVNLAVAQAIELQVPPGMLPFIDEVIGDGAGGAAVHRDMGGTRQVPPAVGPSPR